MRWHDRHSGQRREVKREDVLQAISRYTNHVLSKDGQGFMADDILELLNGKRKEWCEHFRRDPLGWLFLPFGSAPYGKYDDWDTCPVKGCGKKRPEERT